MKNTGKFGGLIASIACLLLCLALVPAVSAVDTAVVDPASAFNAESACASMKEILAQSGDLTALELQYGYSDGSLGRLKLWTEYVVSPGESFCANLERTLTQGNEDRTLSRVIFTTVAHDSRVSYQLSEKSVFERLSEPVAFPAGESSEGTDGTRGSPDSTEFDKELDGRALSRYWARSDDSTTFHVMSAETRIKIWSGGQWADSYYVGDTRFYTTYAYANDPYDYTMTPGTYKQFAHFQGYDNNNVWYSLDQDKPQFVVY